MIGSMDVANPLRFAADSNGLKTIREPGFRRIRGWGNMPSSQFQVWAATAR
jgi:hypothetical protein